MEIQKMKISLLHATMGRPAKAVAAMRAALAAAAEPRQIEYIVACEREDGDSFSAFLKEITGPARIVLSGDYCGSAPAWDAAAKASTGDLLVQMQDDLELPQGWDRMLLERAESLEHKQDPFGTPLFCEVWQRTPLVIAISDGHRSDLLLCTAIMNRARYEQQGEFLHAGYQSVYSDGEFTYRALRDAKARKCTVIVCADIIFLHRHHYHDKSVPMDATYAHENSADAYARGLQLFNQRNPGWKESGLVDWM